MARISRLLLILAFLAALLPTSAALAQAPIGSLGSDEAVTNPLPGLPQPLDIPRSLMEPEPFEGPHGAAPEKPYFELNPYLDPAQLPQPGWFADVEVGILVPNFKDRLSENVTLSDGTTSTVHAAGAPLDWTVSPRFEAGYRLESGFGEVALSYRFLNSSGAGTEVAPDGPASLSSRLDFNVVDLDYISREFSLWPHWDMIWRLGARVTWIYYDSLQEETPAVASAGAGLTMERNTNYFVGGGPHAGVELARHFEDSGLAFVAKADGGSIIGQLRQGFFAQSVTGALGQTEDVSVQDVPMLSGEVGLSWQPPGWKNLQFFAGYEYELWWNVGRFNDGTSRGTMSDQGLLFRASVNY